MDIAHDPIRSFSDDDRDAPLEEDISFNTSSSMSHILDGLDMWQPSTSHDQCDVDTILDSWTDDDDDDNDEINKFTQPSKHQLPPRDQQTSTLQFKLPCTLPPIYRHDLRGDQQRQNPINFKHDGLAVKALEVITNEKNEHMVWNRRVRGESMSTTLGPSINVCAVAKLGCVARACKTFGDAQLFRAIDMWKEHGLVFAWCVAVKDSEVSEALNTLPSDDGDDIIEEDFPPPVVLPPYTPSADDERCLFLFSFAYMQITVSMKSRFLMDNCVGIWAPWTVVPMVVNGEQHNVHIVTRFMTDSIY
ncbi:hypothetical protein DFQ28_001087 [Apophysomyces sp. BC1034]|nr:hypothetical protein DFQ30_001316 [Apophysomyces sp. BC1015]KAG0180483.1 hypothetical protein DFQ29_000628 [Apophysomyces sp. BC1021]KAG0191010.1 hypothetical protein DFQ28_001087 [Apophysomyces sp. BC1034]